MGDELAHRALRSSLRRFWSNIWSRRCARVCGSDVGGIGVPSGLESGGTAYGSAAGGLVSFGAAAASALGAGGAGVAFAGAGVDDDASAWLELDAKRALATRRGCTAGRAAVAARVTVRRCRDMLLGVLRGTTTRAAWPTFGPSVLDSEPPLPRLHVILQALSEISTTSIVSLSDF